MLTVIYDIDKHYDECILCESRKKFASNSLRKFQQRIVMRVVLQCVRKS